MFSGGQRRSPWDVLLTSLAKNRVDFGLYAAVILLSTTLGFVVLGFPGHFSQLPITYSGDGITVSSAVKSIVDTGTYFTNARLGAPGTTQFFDGPGADGSFIVLLSLLALLTRNWILALNLFCLLSYPLIAVSALWSMVSHFLGVGAVTYYVLPGSLAQKIQGLVAAAGAVVFPMSAALFEASQHDSLVRLY